MLIYLVGFIENKKVAINYFSKSISVKEIRLDNKTKIRINNKNLIFAI